MASYTFAKEFDYISKLIKLIYYIKHLTCFNKPTESIPKRYSEYMQPITRKIELEARPVILDRASLSLNEFICF